MTKRKHGHLASARRQPVLLELLKKDQSRVLRVLEKHGVFFDAGTYITLTAPLEKAAAYHAVLDKKKFVRDLLGR